MFPFGQCNSGVTGVILHFSVLNSKTAELIKMKHLLGVSQFIKFQSENFNKKKIIYVADQLRFLKK